ncbi:hypothetical protein FISHEDRAFT_68407 [Fistulina hepatica ATCC 64428]|uniref:Fungal-type protein kinase domain-containing protein n=1 Tax=Fistulina hepatica ATCC 64428 TaxID=1128425 RepID=A0A0D7APP9_9AGAR|nr:hypothetical protein FISHEDRAFT_68407 [Fistulina hepatica ATCC 64428]
MSLEEHKKIYGLLTGLCVGSKVQGPDENAMYDPVIELYQTLVPEIQHIDTSAYRSDSRRHNSRIDFSMTTSTTDESRPFCFIDLPTEFKPHIYQDPFSNVPGLSDDLSDPTSSTQTQSSASSTFTVAEWRSSETSSADEIRSSTSQVPTPKDTWSQLLDCASQVYSSHPRTCLFYVWIGADHARLLRFDSSGIIASNRFAYVPESADEISPLVYFLLSFAAARPVDRGVDPTVHIIDPNGSAEDKGHIAQLRAHPELCFFEKSMNFDRQRRALERLVERGSYRILESDGILGSIGLRITVYDDGDIAKPIDYLAWCPLRLKHSVCGRRTFTYPAIRCGADMGKVPVLLKISNRDVHAKSFDGEIAILKVLNERAVKYLPKFVTGGDMPDDDGLPSISRSREVCKEFQKWRQQRFVIPPLCHPLESAYDVEKCFGALYNAFEAHEDAYGTDETPQEQRALHRDISIGNLMLTPTGHGCLIDWDLAILPSPLLTYQGAARRIGITGTWYFMATCLLRYPHRAVHGYQENIESFMWSFAFCLLKYFRFTNISSFASRVEADVYGHVSHDDPPSGGGRKLAVLQDRESWLRNMQHPQIPSVARWVREVSRRADYFYLSRRIAMEDMDRLKTADVHEQCRKLAQNMVDYRSSFETAMKALQDGRVEIKSEDRSKQLEPAAEDAKPQAVSEVPNAPAVGEKRVAEEQLSRSPLKKR